MKKLLTTLSIITALSSIISSSLGAFYKTGGATRVVENIYGKQITLYGDGIYANDSLLKAGATKGTDIVIIAVGIILLAVLLFYSNRKASMYLQAGLLSIILYSSTCLIMGVGFNRLFMLYVLQFSSSLFAFMLSLYKVFTTENYKEVIHARHFMGTGIFLIISGCSVLIWLTFILPTVVTGQPLETIEIYTTEPTFAIDLAIVLHSFLFCGISLLRKKEFGYRLAPVLLTFLTGVGLCVISQTIYQKSLGITLSIGQQFGLVGSFIILGIIALVLNIRLLKYAK